MYQLAKSSFFPVKSPWSLQILKSRSTSPGTWVAPFRTTFLNTYTAANIAMTEYVDAYLLGRVLGLA